MKSQNASPRRSTWIGAPQPRRQTIPRYAAQLGALAALALPVHLSAQTPAPFLTTPPAQHTTTQRSALATSPQHFTHSVTVDTTTGALKRSTTLGISVTHTSAGAQITISLPQSLTPPGAQTPLPPPRSFYLPEPPRLVVDIPGIAGRRPERLRTAPESAVVRVRIGTHAEKVRVVFDLRTAHRPNVALSSPGTLAFTVPEGGAAVLDGARLPQPVPEEEPPPLTPTETADVTTTPTPPPTTAASPSTATATALPPPRTATPIPTLQPPTQSPTALPATFTPQPPATHTPTPSRTPEPLHSATAAATVAVPPTATAAATTTATGTATHTATPTASSTLTPQPEPTTAAPTPTTAATHTVAPTHTPQPAPTMRPTYTHTPTATPQPSPSATPSATPTPSPSATATHTATPSSQPTLPPTAAPTETVAIAPTSSPTSAPTLPTQPALRISAYRFEYIEPGHTPVLKIVLNQSDVSVQMNRSSARSYTIVVPHCGVASPALTLPHYPPGDFLGFQAIAATYAPDQTEITVHVEQGTSLATFVRGNEIWVQRLQ